jgi:hypothetical protein
MIELIKSKRAKVRLREEEKLTNEMLNRVHLLPIER